MLTTAPIRAYIPVSNLQRARRFYEQTVGLEPGEEYGGGVIYTCGGAEVFMYPTPNAGTSRASQAFWQVADVEREWPSSRPAAWCSRNTTCRGSRPRTASPRGAAPRPPGSRTARATSWR